MLNSEIREKLMSGITAPEDFHDDFARFNSLLANHAGDNSEEIGGIALVRAMFIAQVLEEKEMAIDALEHVARNFEDNEEIGPMASELAAKLQSSLMAEERLAEAIGAPAPELDFTWSNEYGLSSLADLRGKVVVLDFWATWCGPCVRSFPAIRDLTAHYADADVAVIGVTSIQGKIHGLEDTPINTAGEPDREHALMGSYINAKDITWTIAFSEQNVFNEDYGIEGIPHLAIIAPDGTLRHNGLHPSMPKEEKLELIDALLEEFDLDVPEHG
jgi:thiol-disulfide isomerase/thioredoxin